MEILEISSYLQLGLVFIVLWTFNNLIKRRQKEYEFRTTKWCLNKDCFACNEELKNYMIKK